MRVVFFVSRNKDNVHLNGFKERKVSFVSDCNNTELSKKFINFVNEGMDKEFCRMYVSINDRNNDEVLKDLQHFLLDNPHYNLSKMDKKLSSIAANKKNAKTNKWLFDFDDDEEKLNLFVSELGDIDYEIYKTPNNYSIIVEHGFDTRELLNKWDNVELKRDGMLCVDWEYKGWDGE